MRDGTYIRKDGENIDYAARWAYGYVVGVGNLLKAELPRDAVTDWVNGNVPNGTLYGVWHDPESGLTYIDRVRHVDAYSDAMALARAHGELAIYSLRDGIVHYV